MQYNRFNSFIYEDEPIERKKPIIDEFLPKEIKAIRILEDQINVVYQRREKLFCLQGKILENYEDNFVYDKEVLQYYPTYELLSNEELRGYLTWRTNVRKGIINKTYLSYAFLYIYELLNQIGCISPFDAYKKLKAFKDTYSLLDYKIVRYVNNWLNDFIVYYNLNNSLLEENNEQKYDRYLLILININENTDKDIIKVLNELSTYKIINSSFYKKYPQETTTILINIIKKIMDYYRKHHKYSFIDDYFHYSRCEISKLFNGCIFNDKNHYEEYEYQVNDIRKYDCIHGCWFLTAYNTYDIHNTKLGNILRTIDSILRDRFKFPRTLKPGNQFKWIIKIINEEIDLYLSNSEKNKIKEIKIDYSILSNIRNDSNITRDKLITEEIDLEEETDLEEDTNINNSTSLDQDEYHLMQCILYNLDYTWVKDKGLILSVLIDNINEKLFDMFNDNVLEDTNIIEDYLEDLKGMIKK